MPDPASLGLGHSVQRHERCDCGLVDPGREHQIHYPLLCREQSTLPKPEVGLRVIDPAFPDAVWEVVQHDGWPSPIYLRREDDGQLHHHTSESWRHAWMKGYFDHA